MILNNDLDMIFEAKHKYTQTETAILSSNNKELI